MKKFNLLFEHKMQQYSLIKEGGNAVPNVSRIKLEYIQDTIESFKESILNKLFGYELNDALFTLGSTGKKESSGDIDLGIDLNDIFKNSEYKTLDDVLISLTNFVQEQGYEAVINSFSNDMVHIAFPQVGNENNELVQIDVLFTYYPEFTKFYMHSPFAGESKYKGAHRNEILRAIAKCISYEVLKDDYEGNPLMWKQYDISKDGVFDSIKTLIDSMGNKLKYKNTNEDLEISYAKDVESKEITHNVQEAIELLLGDYQIEDIDTFEKLLGLIQNCDRFKYKNKLNEIIDELKARLRENTRLEFPSELE